MRSKIAFGRPPKTLLFWKCRLTRYPSSTIFLFIWESPYLKLNIRTMGTHIQGLLGNLVDALRVENLCG